ncbi:hypothetical protein BJ508DRAFT_363089 [Ascobolus immersus RN42]|uniref:Uncharacterized protein n=1 Tax=Ascobolus immersus RN42 TaxID=1160509 RepID=A0A3N4I2B6_ASCIM|nr:hypothetical protein BJ508DRAFT_363089 [Ascobolus immersus RN42]
MASNTGSTGLFSSSTFISTRPSVELLNVRSSYPSDWVWGYALLRTDYTHEGPTEWDGIISKIRGFLHSEIDFEHCDYEPFMYLPKEALKAYGAAKADAEAANLPPPPKPQLDRGPTEEVKSRLRISVFEDRDALENATIEQAREYFKGLCAAGRIEHGLVEMGFLLVDKETSDSIRASVDLPPDGPKGDEGVGFVKFVEKVPRGVRDGGYPGWMMVSLCVLWHFMKDVHMWVEGAFMIAPPPREDGTLRAYNGNGYVAGCDWESDCSEDLPPADWGSDDSLE